MAVNLPTRSIPISQWTAGGDGKVRGNDPQGLLAGGSGLYDPTSSMGAGGTGNSIFASAAVSVGNGSGTQGDPFNLQQAIDLASPGDVIRLLSSGGSFSDTHPTIGGGINPWGAAYALTTNGNLADPITLTSFNDIDSGNAAVIDGSQGSGPGNEVNVGLFANNCKYWRINNIRFTNCGWRGINNSNQVPNFVPNESNMAAFIVVEDCDFYEVYANEGDNCAGVGTSGFRDSVFRRCLIDGIHTFTNQGNGHGFQSYGSFNVLYENNTTRNCHSGLYHKDHFIQTNPPTVAEDWYPLEVEARYNDFQGNINGVFWGVRGGSTCPASFSRFKNNIIRGGSGAAFLDGMWAAGYGSGGLELHHNLFAQDGGGENIHLQSMGSAPGSSQDIYGNLIVGNLNNKIQWTRYSNTSSKTPSLVRCDYNIYAGAFNIFLERYNSEGTPQTLSSLSAWQALTSSASEILDISNPDTNSITSTVATLFTNYGSGDFSHAGGSPALGMMPDGSNVGPYQTGSETIGCGRTLP